MRMKITEDFTPGDLEVTGFQDENGQPLAITDAAGSTLPNKLVVVVESTHTGVNRNKVEYTMNGLENSVSSWTDNYNKPVLLNHNPYSDNIGRVKKAEYCQSVIDSSKYCIKLTLEITNQAAIERFLDGRYKTFSIGGYTDSAKCSICGKDQMTDGWCGHQRGKKYDGKECYWTLGNMEYDEISVVNCPADPHAQAIDVKIIANEPQQNDNHDGEGNEPGAVKDMFGAIDGLLGKGQTDGTTQDSGDGTGEGENPATGDNNGSQTDNNESDNPDTPQQDDIEALKAQIIERDATIATLQEEKQTDANTIAELTSKLEVTEAAKVEAESNLQLVTDEKTALMDQNVEYAKFAHKVLCEKVADMQILVGDKTAEEKDGIMTELVAMTSKALNDMALEIMNKPRTQSRDGVAGSVTNPVPITDGDDDETTSSTQAKQADLDKFEEAFANFFRTKI